MTFLVGSASTARFSSTYPINSGASGLGLWLVGNPADTAAVATGTAQTLWVYISSWGAQTNAKFCLYDESSAGALLESVIITSAAGTGLISVPLAGTSSITSGNNYRLGIYTEDIDDLTMFSDTGGLTLRFFSSSGSYTTPADPSNQSSGFNSFNELYFAIDDVAVGAATISTADDPILAGATGAHTVTNYTTTINAGSIDDSTYTLNATSANDTAHTIPDFLQNLVVPSGGTGKTFTLTDGTDVATLTRAFGKTGYTWKEVGAPAGVYALKDWAYGFTNALVAADGYWTRDADTFVTHADTGLSTVTTSGTTQVWAWRAADGQLTSISKTYLPDGSVVTSTRRKKLYFRRGNKITYYRKRPPTY